MELIGRRWTSSILFAIVRGAERFSDIVASVDGLSDRMCSVRLRELEHAMLIERIVEPTTPVSVRYRPTTRGRELFDALQPLMRYAQRWEKS